jgi:hypothetical protein
MAVLARPLRRTHAAESMKTKRIAPVEAARRALRYKVVALSFLKRLREC